MKAYVVSTFTAAVSIIVWADKPSRAKSIGITTDWLCHDEYIDLTAKREPRADNDIEHEAICDGHNEEDCRLMRDLGWYEIEGTGGLCDSCGLHEWYLVPESRLVDVANCNRCQGCIDSGDG